MWFPDGWFQQGQLQWFCSPSEGRILRICPPNVLMLQRNKTELYKFVTTRREYHSVRQKVTKKRAQSSAWQTRLNYDNRFTTHRLLWLQCITQNSSKDEEQSPRDYLKQPNQKPFLGDLQWSPCRASIEAVCARGTLLKQTTMKDCTGQGRRIHRFVRFPWEFMVWSESEFIQRNFVVGQASKELPPHS